jgi:hypothetical protein
MTGMILAIAPVPQAAGRTGTIGCRGSPPGRTAIVRRRALRAGTYPGSPSPTSTCADTTGTLNAPLCSAVQRGRECPGTGHIGGYRTRRERLLVTVCNLTPGTG